MLNKQPVDALSCLVHRGRAITKAKKLCAKLKDSIPRHLYDVAIQVELSAMKQLSRVCTDEVLQIQLTQPLHLSRSWTGCSQADVSGKIVARETIKAMRKDVTAKCYGGDISRKMKLLNAQKEGKKKMRAFGNVNVPKVG